MNSIKELKKLAEDITVLYAEDDKYLQDEVATYLEKIFKEVTCAGNGKEAIELFRKKDYDLIITDILMPEMDGIEFSKEIRSISSEKDIIVISAYSESSYFIDLINIGIDYFVLKPIDMNNFNQTLLKILKKIKNEKENIEYQRSLEEKVKEQVKELKTSYFTDTLTGLGNRTKVLEDLDNKEDSTVLVLNVDNFSSINLLFGFFYGDKLLREIGKLLDKNRVEDSRLYRISADVFAFVLREYPQEKALELAHKINSFFKSHDIIIDNIKERITFSIGIDIGYGVNLLHNAETAINYSKLSGKNLISVYDRENTYEREQREKIDTIHKIENGIQNSLFTPFFQPIINNHTGKIEKYEALARLVEDERIIMPGTFIQTAMESGLIDSITQIIIDKSFAAIKNEEAEISINISTKDLYNPYFINFLGHKVEKHGIDPKRVVLEILESVSSTESNDLAETFSKLDEMGFKLSIDDFGSDNSNFSRLLKLNVDYIKIDGQFIKNLPHDENSRKITEAIVSFAKSINSKTIAEYVHNKEVFDYIKEVGIDYSQGFYFSPATKDPVTKIDGK